MITVLLLSLNCRDNSLLLYDNFIEVVILRSAVGDDSNLLNVDNVISINKRIKIFIGIENGINVEYDDIIWFPLGVFVITQPNISHAVGGTTVSLSFKDKMCLLNGECGGGLPTSVTFHEYDQVIGYEEVDKLPAEVNDYTIYCVKDSEGNK